jgi:hypothetical protein
METNTTAGNEPHNPMNTAKSQYQQMSEFTLLVYFKNGQKSGVKFHSWKQETRKIAGHEIKDLRYAMNRLTHLVESEYVDKYKVAILYHNPTGEKIMQWNYNVLKEKRRYSWTTRTNGDVVFKFDDTPAANPQAMVKQLTDAVNYKY